MPRQRLPHDLAQITGAAARNPQRYRDGGSVDPGEPLGDAPDWLSEPQQRAWEAFESELPWLQASDRVLTEIASVLRARLADGSAGVPTMNALRICLGAMGATPADRSRIQIADEPEDDPADRFFN